MLLGLLALFFGEFYFYGEACFLGLTYDDFFKGLSSLFGEYDDSFLIELIVGATIGLELICSATGNGVVFHSPLRGSQW